MNTRITITDIRAAGHCARGAKAWFERHDLDFKDFLKNGIEEEELLKSGDALAVRVVDMKRARNG